MRGSPVPRTQKTGTCCSRASCDPLGRHKVVGTYAGTDTSSKAIPATTDLQAVVHARHTSERPGCDSRAFRQGDSFV